MQPSPDARSTSATAAARAQGAAHAARVDIAIIGGGIAGLWLRTVLHHAGFTVALIDHGPCGGEQTLASQGIVHGGLKYALGAALTRASEASAAMPARWRRLREGGNVPDLQGVPLLSDAVYLYSDGGLADRITGFFASRSLHGRVERLGAAHYPAWIDPARFHGPVYRLDDFVIDVDALVAHLAAHPAGPLVHAAVASIRGNANDGMEVRLVTAMPADAPALHARRVILCAGAGNAALLALAGMHSPAMQLRPLHQVWVHADALPAVYAHCITGARSAEPRLTITTHRRADGTCWSLGGALSTQGVQRSAREQADVARAELAACLPWLGLPALHVETRIIDRAEPRTPGGTRPDTAFVHHEAGVFTCWPTKLTLAPDLGDRVLAALREQQLAPRKDADAGALHALPGLRAANESTLPHAASPR